MATLKILAKISLCLLIHNVFGSLRLDPLVETKVGLIRGLRSDDGEYSMFLGIPYATVNESNPFALSKPHTGFKDTFNADDDSSICPQVENFNNSIVGSFDCLHLNIFVPNKASSQERLPVLVWIYGGAFQVGFYGRYLYGPKYLVRQDIILVTLNYRIGPYGFMCLDTPDVPGNQGLKDQLLALRWINDNIESFGGDVNKITVFGESAGGVSVDFHLLSDQENLFSSAIMQSGTALLDLITESDPASPLKLAEQLGLPTNDLNEALQFLASVDPKLVIAATQQIDVQFLPCVEKDFEKVEKFIKDYPVNLDIPKSKYVNILLGFNDNEGLAFYGLADPDELFPENIFNQKLIDFFNFSQDDLKKFEEILTHFYVGDETSKEEYKTGILNLVSDITFLHPTKRSVLKYLESGAGNIFHYLFSYDGSRNFFKHKNNVTEINGAAHADEIAYLFDISYMTDEPTPEDQLIIDRMTTMWANFVKYGDPTPEISDILPVKWEPITNNSPYYYMNIDSELEVKKAPFKERFAFWDLFYAVNAKFQKGYREIEGQANRNINKCKQNK